ncbi:hypothetical protein Ancab_027973 [Ancistrocladus abbreviatus]
METQDCNSSDIRPEAKVGSANASNNFSPDLIEDFNDVPSNQDDFDQSTIDPSARPSKIIRSKVWDHLIKIRAKNLKDQRAQCKYGNAILGADPATGTSCLKNHIDRCKSFEIKYTLSKFSLSFSSCDHFDHTGGNIELEARYSAKRCSGVVARACGLVSLEPTKIVEILKDRPSWFCDYRSLEVYTMFPAGNGGTIELVHTQDENDS